MGIGIGSVFISGMACAVSRCCIVCGAGRVGVGGRAALSGRWSGADDDDGDEGREAAEDCCCRRIFARPKSRGGIRTALKCGRIRPPRSKMVGIEVRPGPSGQSVGCLSRIRQDLARCLLFQYTLARADVPGLSCFINTLELESTVESGSPV